MMSDGRAEHNRESAVLYYDVQCYAKYLRPSLRLPVNSRQFGKVGGGARLSTEFP